MAQTTVFLNPDKDNSIYAEVTANSNGLGSLYAGVNGADFPIRALLHFDITGNLPTGATIVGANLILDLHRRVPAEPGTTFNIHVLTQDWGEGSSIAGTTGGGGGLGTTALAPDATWTDAMLGTTFWGVAGGDYVAQSSASTLVSSLGTYTWSSGNMIVDVQSWYDNPAINFGWILKAQDETISSTGASFGSKDQGIAPILEVTYTTTLGLEDNSLSQVSIYPNPVTDKLQIRIPAGVEINRIRLFNLLGQQVFETQANSTVNQEVDLSVLQAGVYMVELSDGDNTVVKRIIKE